jgi:hypothetical protein
MTEEYTETATNPRGVALPRARGRVARRSGHLPDCGSQQRTDSSACTTSTDNHTHFALFYTRHQRRSRRALCYTLKYASTAGFCFGHRMRFNDVLYNLNAGTLQQMTCLNVYTWSHKTSLDLSCHARADSEKVITGSFEQ